MSRIGKQPIPIPTGVTVTLDGNRVTVKGPKGELVREFDPEMAIKEEDGQLVVERPSDQRRHRALHGLTRALINNMVVGVSEGYEIRLEIRGTGYRAELQGSTLKLSLGYSHDIVVEPPPDLSFEVKATVPCSMLSGAIEDADIVADSATFITDEDKMTILAEGDLSKVNIDIPAGEDVKIITGAKEKIKAKYSIEYLKKMIGGSKLVDFATVQYSKDYPLKLDFLLVDKLNLSFILAPRVDNE